MNERSNLPSVFLFLNRDKANQPAPINPLNKRWQVWVFFSFKSQLAFSYIQFLFLTLRIKCTVSVIEWWFLMFVYCCDHCLNVYLIFFSLRAFIRLFSRMAMIAQAQPLNVYKNHHKLLIVITRAFIFRKSIVPFFDEFISKVNT